MATLTACGGDSGTSGPAAPTAGDATPTPAAEDDADTPATAANEPSPSIANETPATEPVSVLTTAPQAPVATTAAPLPESSPAQASEERFEGTLLPDKPARREITLQAGDALRMWVRPSVADTDGVSVAISVDPDAFGALGHGWPYDYEENQFFSDYYTYGSVMGGSEWAGRVYPTAEYGLVLVRTAFHSPDYFGSDDKSIGRGDGGPFWFYGRGWGSAAEQGTWATFIAPYTATYSVLLAGGLAEVPFEVSLSTRPTSVPTPDLSGGFDTNVAASSELLPYQGPVWYDVVEDQLPFLFDTSYFNVDGYYSDYFSDDGGFTPGEDEPYGPGPEVVEVVRQGLADARESCPNGCGDFFSDFFSND